MDVGTFLTYCSITYGEVTPYLYIYVNSIDIWKGTNNFIYLNSTIIGSNSTKMGVLIFKFEFGSLFGQGNLGMAISMVQRH